MRSARGSLKEPAARKGSGLGKLMSVLHQNAASLVTTRAAHNGPDQVLPSTDFVTSRRNGPVKLRKDENGLGSEEPKSIPSLLQEVAEAYPEVIALRIKDRAQPAEWRSWSYAQLLADVQSAAKGFIEAGLHRHHSVAIVGANSPEWVISNLAAIMAGGISVGVHTSISPEDLAKVALDSKADIIVVDQEIQLKKVLAVQHKLPELKAIIQMEGEPSVADRRRLHRTHRKHIFSWTSLIEVGQGLPEKRLDERLRKVAINQCCTLAYTSGRNSAPKGVMFSHDNLTWSAKMALGFIRAPGFNRIPTPGQEIILSYLPLSHISTQIIDIYYMLNVAGTTVFPSSNLLLDTDSFFAHLKEVQPSLLYGPPFTYERLFQRLLHMRREASGVERFFLDWTNSRVRQKHGTPSTSTSSHQTTSRITDLHHIIAKNTICKKYKESLGLGPKTIFLCRGGRLQDRLLSYLSGLDIVVHCAYGQTEVTGFLSSNIPKRFCKFSTVGKAVPGVRVKVERPESNSYGDMVGEMFGYGRNICMGYLNKENESRELLDAESWIQLGDHAHLDNEGFIVLEGLKKDQITLSTGLVVHPTELEGNVRLELPCISYCLVVGEGQNRLGALLTLDTVADELGQPTNQLTQHTQAWFKAARFHVKLVSDVIDSLENGLKHVIQAGIDRANQYVPTSQHMIVEWRVLSQNFSMSTGEVGPICKLRRTAAIDKFAPLIQQMFASQDEQRKHSFSEESSSCYQQAGQYEPYTHQLARIQEEEESSNRNSVDKDFDANDSNNNSSGDKIINRISGAGEATPTTSDKKPIQSNQEEEESSLSDSSESSSVTSQDKDEDNVLKGEARLLLASSQGETKEGEEKTEAEQGSAESPGLAMDKVRVTRK